MREALIASGKVRLRPVFLTAVTTILGLVPMATGVDFDFRSLSFITNSESSQWWKSMSIAVIFGLTVATVLTLVMVPTFYRAFFGLGDEKRCRRPRREARDRCVTEATGRAAPHGRSVLTPSQSRCCSPLRPRRPQLRGRPAAGAARSRRSSRATLASEESLRIVEAEVRKAELRTKRYSPYLTPDVRLQGSYALLGSEDDGDGEQEKAAVQDRYVWGLALTQPLYTGGRATAAYRGQKHLEASVRLQVELTGRALTVAAAQAYYGVLGAAAAVDIGEQAIELARRQFERATRRVELGEAVLNDQLRAEVTLRRLEAELGGARSTLAQAREEVRRLSGLELVASPAVPPRGRRSPAATRRSSPRPSPPGASRSRLASRSPPRRRTCGRRRGGSSRRWP